MALKQIKSKILAMKKSQTVTKAMEAVSAAKMRKSQLKALNGRAYAKAAVSVLSRVSGSRLFSSLPLTTERSVTAALYIVITSDKGLAGALNSGVLRTAVADIQASGLKKDVVSIIAVGKKASDFFERRGFHVVHHANTDHISSEFIDTVVRQAIQRFLLGAVDLVKIAYPNLISTFEQRPTMRTILPLTLGELQKVVSDIVPARGVATSALVESTKKVVQSYSLEPSEEEILEMILPKLVSIFVYHALLESQASEHSARMVAMKSASDKAGEMQESLTLKFNKVRQAAITREVSEITGGMEAMAS